MLKWQQAEKKISKKINGRIERASGALTYSNDVTTRTSSPLGGFSVEVKHTIKPSFTLRVKDLQKIRDKALKSGKTPAIAIIFETDDGDLTLWCFFEQDMEILPNAITIFA